MTSIARTLLVPALAACALSTGVGARALPLVAVGVTAGIPGVAIPRSGETYFTARFHMAYTGGPLLLGGAADGSGTTAVDDVATITVTHPDGSVAVFSHDYSDGCQGFIAPLPSLDISSYFQPGDNRVVVTLSDQCGAMSGAQPMWLTSFR